MLREPLKTDDANGVQAGVYSVDEFERAAMAHQNNLALIYLVSVIKQQQEEIDEIKNKLDKKTNTTKPAAKRTTKKTAAADESSKQESADSDS